MKPKARGFTLIELMIVVAIIAIIAAIAVPNLLSARIRANEVSAVSTLRNLVSAEARFQGASAVDGDLDGAGEYGTFGELSGLTLLNARGAGPATPLTPPVLSPLFQAVNGAGEVTRSGYIFALFLPDNAFGFVGELPGGGPAPGLSADACEALWCAYAWPATAATSGTRAFFVNQRGELLQSPMDAVTYSGSGAITAANAAAAYQGPSMATDLGLAAGGVSTSNDGNLWTPVQ
jgi:prepilin-type N-terminal cleavage/methylation domain-containing protein